MGDMFLRLRSGDQRQLQFRCLFLVTFVSIIRIPRSKSFPSRLYLQRDGRIVATTPPAAAVAARETVLASCVSSKAVASASSHAEDAPRLGGCRC